MGAAKRRASRKRVSRRRRRVSRKRVSRKRRTTRKRKTVRKRKARKKVSVRGTKTQVFRGTRQKTRGGGLQKNDLVKNKRNKVVSKKKHAQGKRLYKKNGIQKWNEAFMQARKNLGIKGFMPCKKGSKLYKETMKLYA